MNPGFSSFPARNHIDARNTYKIVSNDEAMYTNISLKGIVVRCQDPCLLTNQNQIDPQLDTR